MSRRMIRTSVLILSDTHNATPFPNGIPENFPQVDLLIHCGDLTMLGTNEEFIRAINMLGQILAANKLVIPGNHDLSLDWTWISRSTEELRKWERQSTPSRWPGELGLEAYQKTQDIWFGPGNKAMAAGLLMLEEGRLDLRLENNALLKLYASPYTPEFCDWGFAYESTNDRFNPQGYSLSDTNNISQQPAYNTLLDALDVDIMITHGPPKGHRDGLEDGCNVGCAHLLRAMQTCRPQLHCFGHIHEGYGAHKVNWDNATLLRPDIVAPGEPLTTAQLCSGWDAINADPSCVQNMAFTWTADGRVAVIDQAMSPRSGRETLLVNAAVMDASYAAVNRPVLVYIDLPAADE